jgi:hypothetical protein
LACVFLLGLDWLAPGRWTEEQIRRLAYVTVSRAREKFFIPYCANNQLITLLIKARNQTQIDTSLALREMIPMRLKI